MKKNIWILLLLLSISINVQSQILDTLVDVGGYKLHFNIKKGKGTPILFEHGGTFKGPPWNNTLDLIHKITGATLITYDWSGFGKSELNPNESEDDEFGIINGMEELETALNKLGYDEDIILVGHAFGALYAMIYAARNPEKTKYMVLLNGHLRDYWTDERLQGPPPDKTKVKLGQYYMAVNFRNSLEILKKSKIPASVPIIDIIAPIYFMTDQDFNDWKVAHRKFVDESPNRQGIIAYGSEHYIFKDSEVLFLNAVTKAYAESLKGEQKIEVLSRGINMTMERVNVDKKNQMEFLNSEKNLEKIGKAFFKNGELNKALEVLKLNTILYPESWKVFDTYGKALLEAQMKTDAIEMYEKSIELNPDYEAGKKILEEIKQN